MTGDDRCRFSLESSDGGAGHLSDVLDSEGVWRCHRGAEEESPYCVFHRPTGEVSADRQAAAFVEAVVSAGDGRPMRRRGKQFIGARFADLSLGFEVLAGADNHPIDLRCAEFGALSLEYATVRNPLLLSGATVEGDVSFREATFEYDVHVEGAQFDGAFDARDADFEDDVSLARSAFEGDASLDDATFTGELNAARARFAEGASFTDASFRGDTSFDDCVAPSLGFADTAFRDGVSMRGLDGRSSGECMVDLRRASVAAGRISTATCAVDLTNATVGAVAFNDPDGDVFESVSVWNTTFDGFEFDGHRDGLYEREWVLHTGTNDLATRPDDRGQWLSELEDTYRQAKQGASSSGDAKASAEFFRQEMTARRQHHGHRALDASKDVMTRAKAAGQWFTNALMDVTAGHGERPSRPIIASVGTVAVFTCLFALLLENPSFDSPLGYLVLGMESFVTLVLAGSPPVNDIGVQVLAEVEAFIGAYLIALFVFTLSRSVHR